MTSTAQTVEYTFRAGQPGDEPAILDLLRLSLGESESLQRTSHMWRWKHVDNPFGASEVLVAIDPKNEVAALRAFMRWAFSRNGETITAVRAVDTATHPDHRRFGLFTRLTLRAAEEVKAQGTGFVFNTPNDQSRPGYMKMGWQPVATVSPLVRMLRPHRFAWEIASLLLRKKNASRHHEPKDFFGKKTPLTVSDLLAKPGLDELLEADAQQWRDLLHTPRTRAYLQWRYAYHPTIPYHAVTVEEKGRIVAGAVFRTNTRYGMREIVITELLLSRLDASLARRVVKQLIRAVKADYLIAYFPAGSFHRQALRGFIQAPKMGMTLVANPLNVPFSDLSELPRWGISLGDLEFF
jgi:hypothetical protein